MDNNKSFWYKVLGIAVLWGATLIPTFLILLFARNYALNFKISSQSTLDLLADYFTKIGIYTMVYALFVIIIFLIVEYIYKKKIHPIQYLLVLLSLMLFNMLCLSFTEFIPFWIAYLISSTLIISLITYYASGFYNQNRFPLKLASFLVLLYSFMFVMISFPEASLLIGSISFFILLACVMYFTRKVDFYDYNKIYNSTKDNHPSTSGNL